MCVFLVSSRFFFTFLVIELNWNTIWYFNMIYSLFVSSWFPRGLNITRCWKLKFNLATEFFPLQIQFCHVCRRAYILISNFQVFFEFLATYRCCQLVPQEFQFSFLRTTWVVSFSRKSWELFDKLYYEHVWIFQWE